MTWAAKLSQNVAQTASIFDLHFPTALIGWAVADTSSAGVAFVRRSADGGETWAATAGSFGTFGTTSRAAIHGVGTNHAWIVSGDPGTNYARTTNAGASWTTGFIGSGFGSNQIFFVDTLIGYFTSNNGRVFKSIDGGATWPTVQVLATSANADGIFFLDASTGFVTAGPLIFKTTNGGTNWTQVFSGSGGYDDIFFSDSNNGWACNSIGQVARTTNGGTSWTVQQLAVGNVFRHIHFSDPNNGFLVGGSNRIYKTSDGGANWLSSTGVLDLTLVESVFMLSTSMILIGGNAGAANLRILKSADGGFGPQSILLGVGIGAGSLTSSEDSPSGHKIRSILSGVFLIGADLDLSGSAQFKHKLRPVLLGIGIQKAYLSDGITWVFPIAGGSISKPGPTITLDWTDGSGSAPPASLIYHVEVSSDAGLSWSVFMTTAAGITQAPFNTGTFGIGQYFFRVRADDGGVGDFGGLGPWAYSPALTVANTALSRIRFLDPVTGAVWKNIFWPWTDPKYEGFIAQPLVSEFGGLTPIRQVSPAEARRQVLVGSGTCLPDAEARIMLDIIEGRDITNPWHTAKVEFMDLYGQFWTVVIDKFEVEFVQGLREWHWSFRFLVEAAPAQRITGCDAGENIGS